jgi:hypothetical protein
MHPGYPSVTANQRIKKKILRKKSRKEISGVNFRERKHQEFLVLLIYHCKITVIKLHKQMLNCIYGAKEMNIYELYS